MSKGIYFTIIMFLLLSVISGCGGSDGGDNSPPPATPAPTVTGPVTFADLEPGMCADVVDDDNGIAYLEVMACTESHQYEYAGVGSLEALGAEYPGRLAIDREAHKSCRSVFASHTGQTYTAIGLGIETIVPSVTSWSNGDSSVICLVVNADRSPLTASVAR